MKFTEVFDELWIALDELPRTKKNRVVRKRLQLLLTEVFNTPSVQHALLLDCIDDDPVTATLEEVLVEFDDNIEHIDVPF